MITELIILLTKFIVNTISTIGYFGVFILMALESMITPVPSELVLPFAGFLVAEGRFNFWLVTLVSALGCVLGSSLSYYAGYRGGKPFILKFGKFLLLNEADLDWAQKWFKQRGDKTIFISRFIPVVRHVISIPAGLGKMNFKKFVTYTFIGSLMWSFILVYVGYLLGKNWEKVHIYTKNFSIIILALLIIIIIIFIYRHTKKRLRWVKKS